MAASYGATLPRSANISGEILNSKISSNSGCQPAKNISIGCIPMLQSLEQTFAQPRRNGLLNLKAKSCSQLFSCKCTSGLKCATVSAGLRHSVAEMGRVQRAGRNKTCRVQAFPFSSRTTEPAQPAPTPANGTHEVPNGKNGANQSGFASSEETPDMNEISAKVAAIERQEAAMVRELNHFASLVMETSRVVTERANSTRIEMAKLRKTVQLQQQEELRRIEEVRRQGEEKIKEDYQRMEEMRKVEDERRALEAARLVEIQEQASTLEALEAVIGFAPKTSAAVEQGLAEGLGEGLGKGLAEAERENGREVDEAGLERGLGFGGLEEGARVLGPDAVAVPEKYECVVAHPGALCCTKTYIRKDPILRTAVIDMQTTVQCTGDALSSAATLSLNSDDFVALGVHSLAEAAADLTKSRVAQLVQTSPDVAEKHREILDVLATGKIVSARPMEPPSTFGHESFVVELLDNKSGKKVTALFKPKVEGDADGWHRAPVELIAYELNLMLGMDYIPPVAYRKSGIDVNYRHYDEGAFIYFVPCTKPLKKVPAASWGVSVARLLSDTRVIDVLLNNSDRHAGHFLFGEHWADAKMRPVLIDHAAGFRKEAVVHMEHENAFQTGSVRCVSARTYLRLRFLEKSQIADKFSDVLSEKEMDGLLKRKDMVLAYLDKLVAERGYHRTVIE